MSTFYCIYLGEYRPESERSEEHILPWALGGTNSFVTRDVSTRGNNEAGKIVDSSLINNWMISCERWRLKIKGQSGKIPPLEFKGTIEIDGKTVDAIYTVDSNMRMALKSIPIIDCDWESKKIQVNCDPAQLGNILGNISKKSLKKGFGSLNVDKIIEQNSSKVIKMENPEMEVGMKFGIFDLLPGFLKIALATGHKVLGDTWSRGSEASLIREMMWERDVANYPKYKISGAVWPNCGNASHLKSILSAGKDNHIIAVLNTNPVSFYCVLFGEFDGMIKLSDGIWMDGNVPPGDGLVYIFNCSNRNMTQYTFLEYIGKRTQGMI